jgi:bifunctional non-homologous end joining protein LigD
VIVPSANGVSDFSVLQNELRGKSNKLVLYAFDLLYLNGYDLRKAPLFERKAALRSIIADTDILFSESFEPDGAAMVKQACKMGLEGVVSKVRDSRYVSGRINDWVKVTCRQRETLPIAGLALKENRFDGLYVGRLKGEELIYAGKVDHGFDTASAKDLQARLKPLIWKTQPYAKKDVEEIPRLRG